MELLASGTEAQRAEMIEDGDRCGELSGLCGQRGCCRSDAAARERARSAMSSTSRQSVFDFGPVASYPQVDTSVRRRLWARCRSVCTLYVRSIRVSEMEFVKFKRTISDPTGSKGLLACGSAQVYPEGRALHVATSRASRASSPSSRAGRSTGQEALPARP